MSFRFKLRYYWSREEVVCIIKQPQLMSDLFDHHSSSGFTGASEVVVIAVCRGIAILLNS
jgi:hypothetical protein